MRVQLFFFGTMASLFLSIVNAGETATEKPILQCSDKTTAYCTAQSNARNLDYCVGFGLLECCLTCRARLAADPDAARNANPMDTCRDDITTDGSSYTDWCKVHVVPKEQSAAFSCYGPVVAQHRCLKACDLCEKPAPPPNRRIGFVGSGNGEDHYKTEELQLGTFEHQNIQLHGTQTVHVIQNEAAKPAHKTLPTHESKVHQKENVIQHSQHDHGNHNHNHNQQHVQHGPEKNPSEVQHAKPVQTITTSSKGHSVGQVEPVKSHEAVQHIDEAGVEMTNAIKATDHVHLRNHKEVKHPTHR